MSFAQGFGIGVSAGTAFRDRYDDKKKRKEDIRLKLEQEERQMNFERERRAQQLKDDLEKMGYGGEIDLKKLAAQIEGQGRLQGASHQFTGGQNALNRTHQSQMATDNRTFQAGESAAERKARADQVKRQLDLQEAFGNADIGFKAAETGGRLLDASTRAGRMDRTKLAEVKRTLEDGSTATYDMPVSEFNQPKSDGYSSPYAKAIAEAEQKLAEQQIQLAEGDNRTGLGFSRSGIADETKKRWLRLKALELQDKVSKGVITREQANTEATRLKGM